MLNPTTARRWTLATWLLAGCDDGDAAAIGAALAEARADAIALQSIDRGLAERVAAGLGATLHWDLSHYRLPLLRSGGVGLAVVTPHSIREHSSAPAGEARSTWSSKRRISQAVLVERDDKSAYAFVHAVPPIGELPAGGDAGAPTVVIRPAQVGVDAARAVQIPPQATIVTTATTTPLAGRAALLTATFEQDWVNPDLPPVR